MFLDLLISSYCQR